MFIISKEYDRDELLDFVGSKQDISGIIWGPKEPGCIIVTSGGRGGKSAGYGDSINKDGTIFYIGQGAEGDQNPGRYSNSLLVNGERSVLFFSTREPNAEEVRQRGNYRKLYKFEGIFEVASWSFDTPVEGKRKGDKLLKFLLVPANNVYNVETPVKNEDIDAIKNEKNFKELRKILSEDGNKPKKGIAGPRDFYYRSQNIIAYAKTRADGICELCIKPAPFKNHKNDPFLEVHHIFRLADDGPDAPENVAAICPNCHREAHYGKNKETIKIELAEIIKLKEEKLESLLFT